MLEPKNLRRNEMVGDDLNQKDSCRRSVFMDWGYGIYMVSRVLRTSYLMSNHYVRKLRDDDIQRPLEDFSSGLSFSLLST